MYKFKTLAEFNANDYQAIVLPGGPGFKVLEANETVKAAIKTFDAEDNWYVQSVQDQQYLADLDI